MVNNKMAKIHPKRKIHHPPLIFHYSSFTIHHSPISVRIYTSSKLIPILSMKKGICYICYQPTLEK